VACEIFGQPLNPPLFKEELKEELVLLWLPGGAMMTYDDDVGQFRVALNGVWVTILAI
jgi:hypothetical protein